jgi:DNA repair exonuclease SbcCD ATPase subunit
MTITPIALRMERFRSFLKQQTFTFPTEPGLYLMLGKNEVEPRLGGNAAGKSTIWDALTWLTYARTHEGLKAGDVCTWGEKKGTLVAFDFHEDGAEWTCTRTWGPNTWTLKSEHESIDLAKDPENPLLASLRLSLDAWLCTVVMAQGGDYFLDMDKGKQASLFGSVMDLEEWERRSERASKAAAAEDARLRSLESSVARIRGKLEAGDVMGSADMAREWEEKQRECLDSLKMDHDDLCKRRRRLKDALEQAQTRERERRDALGAVKRDSVLEDEYDLVCVNVRRLEDSMLREEVAAKALHDALTRKDGLKDGNCPVCGKPLSTHDWQKEMERMERNAHAIKATVDGIKYQLDIARKRRDVLEVEIDKVEDAERAAARAVGDAEADVSRARTDLALCDKELDRLEDLYEATEREENPFTQAMERAKREAEGLRDALHEAQRQLEDCESLFAIKSMWVRGFKEIRLREIASSLSELEVEVNNAVMALGLDNWELRFDVDRETKGGTVQKGFAVTVLAPSASDKPVPWEAWSGGEKQRLRIAGNAGLSDLVRARTGCDFPLEVWDEPTNGLSPEGKIDLFRYLAERARNESRIVFLLDHQAHDFGGFAGTCTIIKTPSGSRVRTSW